MFSSATRYFTYGVLLALLAVVLWLAATSLRRSPEGAGGGETTTIHVGTPLVGDRPQGEPPADVGAPEESATDGDGAAGTAPEEGSGDDEAPGSADDAAPATPASPAGEDLYRSARCAVCHGDDLAGNKQGPPLTGLSRHYSAEELKMFLRDPAAYAIDNQRLSSLGRQYKLVMPEAKLPDDDLATLAQWLLAQ